MDSIKDVLEILERKQTYTELSRVSGISRTTIFNVRKNPENSSLKVLRQIFGAMGYRLVLSFEKEDKQNEVS